MNHLQYLLYTTTPISRNNDSCIQSMSIYNYLGLVCCRLIEENFQREIAQILIQRNKVKDIVNFSIQETNLGF